MAYDLMAASTDERVAGEQVLDWVWQARILGDKGFIGADWQQGYRETRGLEILTPARTNQRPARPATVQRWLNRPRERIEGAFHEVQNIGRHLEHLTCRTLRGLCTHVAAKMASHAPGSCSAVRPELMSRPSPWPFYSTFSVMQLRVVQPPALVR